MFVGFQVFIKTVYTSIFMKTNFRCKKTSTVMKRMAYASLFLVGQSSNGNLNVSCRNFENPTITLIC